MRLQDYELQRVGIFNKSELLYEYTSERQGPVSFFRLGTREQEGCCNWADPMLRGFAAKSRVTLCLEDLLQLEEGVQIRFTNEEMQCFVFPERERARVIEAS